MANRVQSRRVATTARPAKPATAQSPDRRRPAASAERQGKGWSLRSGGASVMTSAEVLLDDVQVYSHITEGGIYDVDGEPGPYLSGLREMNAAMD